MKIDLKKIKIFLKIFLYDTKGIFVKFGLRKPDKILVSKEDLVYGIHKTITKFSSQHGGILIRDLKKNLNQSLFDFTKQNLNNQIGKGKVYFDLTGMSDLQNILQFKSKYNQDITARELRYIYQN